MAAKPIILTPEGYKKLEEELRTLKVEGRTEIAEKIKEARSFGDLSENAEYDEAKNEQAEVEAEISRLEEMIKFAKVVDEGKAKANIVTPGKEVTIFDVEMDEEMTFRLVGSMEADIEKKRLSYESPIGAALLNKKVGDEIKSPEGDVFKILKIK